VVNRLRLAVVTDDEVNVSKHFGRAPYFLIVEVEGGYIKEKKLIPKLGHGQFYGTQERESMGLHMGSEQKHRAIMSPILDFKVEVLICGGMGMGAYQSMILSGVRPIITTIDNAEEAIEAYPKRKNR